MNSPASPSLDRIADQFDQLWRSGSRPNLAQFVESLDVEPSLRRDLLQELVIIDMEYRWREAASDTNSVHHRPPLLHDYTAAWPELAEPQWSASIVAEEFRIRHRWGDAPDKQLYRQRFANRADVAAALAEVEEELSADKLPSNTQNVRPKRHETSIGLEWIGKLCKLNRYRLIDKLGEGGMGEVFLMEDLQLNRRVALKKPRLHLDAQAAQRLLIEARAAAAIHHPNVCPVYDFGETAGQPFITMAYIEGETLAGHLARTGPLSVARVRHLFTKLTGALHEAHACGVLHRDLKPSNIMIDRYGEPMLMDFGLAFYQSGGARITQPGDCIGSPAYMAPEQLSTAAGDVGPPTDIYGLGAILYEGLTGHVPFEGSLHQTVSQVLHDDPPPVSAWRTDVPAQVEQLCLRMLAKSPSQRPALPEVAEQLAALEETPALQPTPSPSKRPRLRSRRVLPWLLGLAVPALLMLGWLGMGAVGSRPGDEAHPTADESHATHNRPDTPRQQALPLAAGQVWVGEHQHGFGKGQAALRIDRLRDQQVEATLYFALDRNLEGIPCTGRLVADRFLWERPGVTYDGRIQNGRAQGQLTGSGHSGTFDLRLQKNSEAPDLAGSVWEGTEQRGSVVLGNLLLEVETQRGQAVAGTITVSNKYGRGSLRFSGRVLGDYLLILMENDARYWGHITGRTMEGSTYSAGHGATFSAKRNQ